MKNERKMKTFIVFAACILLTQARKTQDRNEKLIGYRTECLRETKIEEKLKRLLQSGRHQAESEPMKEYAFCMLVKSGLMTKDGKFLKDVALAKISNPEDKPNVEKLIDTCLAKKGKTAQQTAWNYIKCYQEKGNIIL